MQKFYLYICAGFFHIPLYPSTITRRGAVTKLIQEGAVTGLISEKTKAMKQGRS